MQVWRPTRRRAHSNSSHHQIYYYNGDTEHGIASISAEYTLVGQTYFPSNELRFQEVPLQPQETINVRRGDLLGLHFVHYNPITWSTVPCAHAGQRYLRAEIPRRSAVLNSTSGLHHHGHLHPGTTLRFATYGGDDRRACRQYSFTALLGMFKQHC